jgi:hypothetical protein
MKLPMIAYLYDEETGVYLNRSVEATPDPKQRGMFNVPVNATLDPPPSVPNPDRQIAVFYDDQWHVERRAGAPDGGTDSNTKTKKVKPREDQTGA